LDGPADDWQEGPGLVESVRHYKWLVAAAALVAAIAGFLWSSAQPVSYEGVVRVFLDTGGDQTEPGRIVRSQAEFLSSPVVLDRTVALIDGRLTRTELEKRLTVEPARDADFITIRILDATPEQAAGLANTIVRAYRGVLAQQANDAARQEAAAVARRQQRLESEIDTLSGQLRDDPSNPRLLANRAAKEKQLNELADQVEAVRRDAERASRRAEALQETAAIPEEPAAPKPLRTAVIAALLAMIAAAGLAWWLHGRRPAPERQPSSLRALGGGTDEDQAGLGISSLLRMAARPRDGRAGSANGSRSTSGIADFDHIATSVQELFHFLDGPPQRLYEENLPQLAAEEIAGRFQVDLVAILLDNAGEVQTMGSVGLQASWTGTFDRDVSHLIEAAARSGPRLIDNDELARLAQTGLEGDQVDSIALVPLVRDQVGFGVLLAGRRHTDERVAPLTDHEVQEIADSMRDIMVPYLWAWLLLRDLKLRLGTLR
jgi:capsular polysaccharide biosynthesis protein